MNIEGMIMQEVKNDRKLQREMHKDFFDRCRNAIDNGCYFEAVLMEYASIEARLEVIMGVIGLPCNKQLSSKERQSIIICHNGYCLWKIAFHYEANPEAVLPPYTIDLHIYNRYPPILPFF